jgi:glycosyltransferase involved in cell wall biosynthesis
MFQVETNAGVSPASHDNGRRTNRDPMRILNLIDTVNPVSGGTIEVVKEIAACITSNGSHIVEIACTDPPDAPYLKDVPVPVHPCGTGLLRYGGRGLLTYAYSPRLRNWLLANHENYDCIVVNGLWTYVSRVTRLVLRNSNTPYVLYTHGMLNPWSLRRYPLKRLKKLVYWSVNEQRVLRDAKAVVFSCEEERRLARQSFRSYNVSECVIVSGIARPAGNGVFQRSAFLDRYPDLRGRRLLTQIGRIHPVKGCDLAIEAFARVLRADPDWHLVIVGPDPVGLQKRLCSIAETLNVSSRITWTGMLQGDLKWGAIRASEAFLLPSHQENFGIAVVEALSCGVPVLISNKINIWREIERDGGGIARNDDLEGTCDLLRLWLAMTPDEKAGMRQRAGDSFARRFEITRTASTLLALLKRVTNVPGAGEAPEVERYVRS